ncbi:DUF2157 domain-containing protein [Chitinophaga ginsengisoli]|uniref:Putative membrane protein DUF2157 n=1 Tax=Chitinophaga ginsengisoli TaxID=363837 RepID=A0A2P8G2V9_9BACT|nr:DUF2157 domain-containing protein [Chitinophaga ginsengisoli]PSL28312.1 putative membrane protein DUF2157 [Chitinophaga ginsengisoli]
MDIDLFEQLQKEGTISAASAEKVRTITASRLFSVHWELKTILYLGVLLLSGGLGILIYKNIDTIGHQVILLAIALACGGCFYYSFRHKLPFSRTKVPAPNSFFDYILLLGCLLLVTFITYLQVQYNVFGTRYGAATFIPMLVLFFSAYYFDHLGILSMAITNLAAWMGVTVTPLQLLTNNDFSSYTLIYTGLVLGALLIITALLSHRLQFKAHFSFTYSNFGTHVFLIANLAGMFAAYDGPYGLWFLLLVVATIFFYSQAMKQHSFYFVLIITLYAYIGLSFIVVRLLMNAGSEGGIYAGLLYFIMSGIGAILLLINVNKKLKTA